MLVVSAKLVAPWLTTAVDGHGELSEPAAVLRKAARRWRCRRGGSAEVPGRDVRLGDGGAPEGRRRATKARGAKGRQRSANGEAEGRKREE